MLERVSKDCKAQYIRERFWSWEKVCIILYLGWQNNTWEVFDYIDFWPLEQKSHFCAGYAGSMFLYSMVPCTLIDTIPHTLGGYDWGYLATVRLNRSKVWSGVLISTLFIFHFSVALCFLTWALVTPALMSELTVKTVSNSPPWKLLVFARLSLIFKQLKKKIPFHL